MKKTILGLFLGMSVMGMAAVATNDVSSDLNIKAVVIAPLSIEEKTAMDFGNIILGTADIAHDKTPGMMLVTGVANNNIIVTVPDKAIISKAGQDGSDVTVELFSLNSGDTQTLSNAGTLEQKITGTIAPEQTKFGGTYSGTVSISARYN